MTEKPGYQDKTWLNFYEEGVPESIEYEEICLPEILNRTAARSPDHIALIFQGYKVTFKELKEMVDRFATCLAGFGIRRGMQFQFYFPMSFPVSQHILPY